MIGKNTLGNGVLALHYGNKTLSNIKFQAYKSLNNQTAQYLDWNAFGY